MREEVRAYAKDLVALEKTKYGKPATTKAVRTKIYNDFVDYIRDGNVSDLGRIMM